MNHSSDSERPAKRIKRSQPYQRPPSDQGSGLDHTFTEPYLMPSDFADNTSSPYITSPQFPASHTDLANVSAPWQQNTSFIPTPDHFSSFSSVDSQETTYVPSFPTSVPTVTPSNGGEPALSTFPATPNSASTATVLPSFPTVSASPTYRQTPVSSRASLTQLSNRLLSPFHDCVDSFGTYTTRPDFRRPAAAGAVSGYIKLSWKKPKRASRSGSATRDDSTSAGSMSLAVVPETVNGALEDGYVSNGLPLWLHRQDIVDHLYGIHQPSARGRVAESWAAKQPLEQNQLSEQNHPPERLSSHTSPSSQSDQPKAMTTQYQRPRLLPYQFGFQAKMEDRRDRKFWEFYINNWCPGRSVLKNTNLWLTDFAPMHESPGIMAAMQSLAGVYIYDYMPHESISQRVNELFNIAESRLTILLNHGASLVGNQGRELITISVLLSMQDVVLIERRKKRPSVPRWLQGFMDGEHALDLTDSHDRFWNTENVQVDSLRTSQSIIVARAIILSQPMMPLPRPEDFDLQRESSRFGWLLYGKRSDMSEIHGGCGFSPKLLHLMSQVRYCAARIQQNSASPIAPMTASFLLDELVQIHQWTNETKFTSEGEAELTPIDWVRSQAQGYTIDTSAKMTYVTAEAWRLAAMVYTQCRALRLPRNHRDVMTNLSDLAHCVRIMPTSGPQFTAQAPLFPIFLLGLVAWDPSHKQVARQWFEKVAQTPVRSSVPPLFEVLQRAWTWIDDEIPITDQPPADIVGDRPPWWEHLVALVQKTEPETLCLT